MECDCYNYTCSAVCSCGGAAVCKYVSSSHLYRPLGRIERYEWTNEYWILNLDLKCWLLTLESWITCSWNCWLFDVERWISNVDSWILNVQFSMWSAKFECSMPNVEYSMLIVRYCMLNVEFWMFNAECWILNLE